MNAVNLKYVPALDGLRAFAVTGVLISHYRLGEPFDKYINLVPWGDIGVRFFFVLSGFLITMILLNCKKLVQEDNLSPIMLLRQFYVRRFLRIFPLFYGVLLLAYIFNVGHIREIIIYHIFYLSNTSSALTGTLAQAPLIDPPSAHFWSLAVEEQFYLFWPFIVLFVPIKRIQTILIILILSSPLLRLIWFLLGYQQLYSYLPMCIDTLGCGAILAMYRTNNISLPFLNSKKIKVIFVISVSVLILSLFFYSLKIWYRPRIIIMDLSQGIVYSFFINSILNNKFRKLNYLLEISVLKFIGKISYGIYVIHAFMPHIFSYFFEKDHYSQFMLFIIYFIMSISFSSLSFLIYENNFNKLKKYFPYDYRKSS